MKLRLGCGPKRKRQYKTQAIALMKINRTKSVAGAPALRTYKCPACRYWHLTSQIDYVDFSNKSRSTRNE